MKKILIITYFFCLSIGCYAQTLTKNGSFENWNTYNSKLYLDSWNFDSTYIDKNFIRRVSGGTEGQYSILLGGTDLPENGPEILQTGSLTSVPGGLTFDYKISGFSDIYSNCKIVISFYDNDYNFIKEYWNRYSGYSDKFESANLYFSFSIVQPKYYKISIKFWSFSANNSDAVTIDNIRFINSNNIISHNYAPAIKIYPNPATALIFIENFSSREIKNIKLIAIDGKVSEFIPGNSTLDISGLKKGIYIIELYTGNQTLIKREKINLIN